MGSVLIEILKECSLFSGQSEKTLEEIAVAGSLKTVSKGEIIFSDGEPANSFFVVGSGRVKIFKLSPEGKEQILMIAKAGETFAEATLLAGATYPASSQAMEDCSLIAFSCDKFVSLLGRNPELAVSLIARLSELLRKMAHLVEELSLNDVTTRLAHHLISLVGELQVGKETEFILDEQKTVLASLLGTIPETLSRSFAKLVRDGVISVDGRKIKLMNINRLQEIAEHVG